jgi:hypothetical protein
LRGGYGFGLIDHTGKGGNYESTGNDEVSAGGRWEGAEDEGVLPESLHTMFSEYFGRLDESGNGDGMD